MSEREGFDPVVEQLAAYNARDLERFLACYAPDCAIDDGAGATLMCGHDAMRRTYGAMFAATPELHCELLHRARIGPFVVDEERVTERGEPLHAVAIYRVEDGRIAHVRMLR